MQKQSECMVVFPLMEQQCAREEMITVVSTFCVP